MFRFVNLFWLSSTLVINAASPALAEVKLRTEDQRFERRLESNSLTDVYTYDDLIPPVPPLDSYTVRYQLCYEGSSDEVCAAVAKLSKKAKSDYYKKGLHALTESLWCQIKTDASVVVLLRAIHDWEPTEKFALITLSTCAAKPLLESK